MRTLSEAVYSTLVTPLLYKFYGTRGGKVYAENLSQWTCFCLGSYS